MTSGSSEWLIEQLSKKPLSNMAMRSSEWWDEEMGTEYKALQKMGMKAGLHSRDFTESDIAQLVALDEQDDMLALCHCRSLLNTQDKQAAFYALMGRGSSGCDLTRDYDLSEIYGPHVAAALFANLSSNTNLKMLTIRAYFPTAQRVLGAALRLNSALQELSLMWNPSSKASKYLAEGIIANKTLVSLSVLVTPMMTWESLENMSSIIRTNTTLRTLSLGPGLKVSREGWKDSIFPALKENKSLEKLRLKPTWYANNEEDGNFNGSDIRFLITNNETLFELYLYSDAIHGEYAFVRGGIDDIIWGRNGQEDGRRTKVLGQEDWKEIFLGLKKNKPIHTLVLSGKFVRDAKQALMDMLGSNTTGLKKIDLSNSGLSSLQGQVDEVLKRNGEFQTKLQGGKMVEAAVGRLVLCGYGFAGKTTIRKTMEHLDEGNLYLHTLSVGSKKLMQTSRLAKESLFGKNVGKDLTSRTRGFDILTLEGCSHLKTVWDFAGQREYYALHDYLFPEVKNSCFLYVSSCQDLLGCQKDEETMQKECEYWMKFIASNSKPFQGGESDDQRLPCVRFVLTNRDRLKASKVDTFRQRAQRIVRHMKLVFKGIIDVCATPEIINAHSLKDVKHLLTLTNDKLKEILADQKEYVICEDVRKVLDKISTSCPIMSQNDFHGIHEDKFDFGNVPIEIRHAVIAYLDYVGEVIHPKDFDYIVVNPRWFGVCVFGALINGFKGLGNAKNSTFNFWHREIGWGELVHDKGHVDREDLEDLLQQSLKSTHLEGAISSHKLVELMIRLELCFENKAGNVHSSVFFPALFDDNTEKAAKGVRKLQWKLEQIGQIHYLGRRLECENKATTFLTPGFFPRLQVHLRNYIHDKKWTKNEGFLVDRNLIGFAHNGIEVLVEYSGDLDYFVDILVRSSQSYAKAVKFIDVHVIQKIQRFCASPQGCRGVTLVEAVIRPTCVRDLHLCKSRIEQSVLVSELEDYLEENEDYLHTWDKPIQYVHDFDFALELLKGEKPHMISAKTGESSASTSSSSNLTDQFPKLFYPSIDDVGLLRRLDAQLNLSKTMPVKLHLLCEHKDGSHKVEDQSGRTITLDWTSGSYDLSITKLAMTLMWAGVGAGTGAFGVRVQSPLVDSWIQSLFNVPKMPDIDAKTLLEMMDQGRETGPVSEEQILKALERYWRIDPYSQGLKQILNLQDGKSFWEHFRVRKVIYTEAPHPNRIGWVCQHHYQSGLSHRILKSAHH